MRIEEERQGLPPGTLERMGPGAPLTEEGVDLDRRMAQIDAMLRSEGFGKRRKTKKGGAKAMTPDQIHSVVMQRNKAFAMNNEATQLPRAPMTYLAIKPDNSLGTLGAGKKKKDIVMKQKDFVKEHKKLVSLLGKTSNSLKSEAQEQTQELGKFDPETAKMLEKTVVKEKLKAGRKSKKSKQDLPTLVFDDNKNDWYL